MIKGRNISQIFKHTLLALLAMLWMLPPGFGQMSVAINDLPACEDELVTVSVDVEDFNDVAAFTFYIEFDTLMLEYKEVLNLNSQLAVGSIIANLVASDNHKLIVTWTSISPVFIQGAKLFDISLTYFGGYDPMDFTENCEIVLSDLSIVEDASFKNGSVFPMIEITQQPLGTTADEGDIAIFTIEQVGGTEYQWQVNQDGNWEDVLNNVHYSGANTDELSITDVPLEFDGNIYRCMVSANGCAKISGEALLEVTPLTTHNSFAESGLANLMAYPNPCRDVFYLSLNHDCERIEVQLINTLGNKMFSRSSEHYTSGSKWDVPVGDLSPGIYYLRVLDGKDLLGTQKLCKQ